MLVPIAITLLVILGEGIPVAANMEVRGQCVGVGSLLSQCGTQELNSGPLRVVAGTFTLPSESPHQPTGRVLMRNYLDQDGKLACLEGTLLIAD